ncbi:MAG: hypothetical protein IKO46_10850 [Salinivirgaceae bacterium]|nr:hypothetical protein [Salinivirgaceae bacterium]MBR4621466.1 hypothetical protein [Salinivirgaceae bacterium]
MNQLAEKYNIAYPELKSEKFHESCTIVEPQNNGTEKFQEIVLTGWDGILFPHELARKTSSFPSIAKHTSVLNLDCDGIVIFEKNGEKYILFCELKSSFIWEDITHAKDQLIGSSVKLKGLLNTLQGFNTNDYKYIGLIVSFEPTQEQLTNISKNDNAGAAFAISLNSQKHYFMPADKCDKYYYPLAAGQFDIYYISVPNRQTTISVNVNSFLK